MILLALVLLLQPLPPREPEPAYPYPAPAATEPALPPPVAAWLDHERVRITWTGAPCVLAERPSAGALLLCDADGEVVLPDDVAERDTVARPQKGDRYCPAPGTPEACSAPLGLPPAPPEHRLALPLVFRR